MRQSVVGKKCKMLLVRLWYWNLWRKFTKIIENAFTMQRICKVHWQGIHGSAGWVNFSCFGFDFYPVRLCCLFCFWFQFVIDEGLFCLIWHKPMFPYEICRNYERASEYLSTNHHYSGGVTPRGQYRRISASLTLYQENADCNSFLFLASRTNSKWKGRFFCSSNFFLTSAVTCLLSFAIIVK